jgi:hypothetical protein
MNTRVLVHHGTGSSIVAATTLVALLVLVGACLMLGLRRRGWRRVLLLGAGIGVAFQVAHFAEHVAQAGYWAWHSSEAPWMTPWAGALARSFGSLAPGTPSFGMEAMHLVGNAIFLAGALATVTALTRFGPASSRRPARTAVWVQSVHVLEHVALTVSVVLTGRAIGMSTGFGALDPGPSLWTYRVWWHLTINALATALLVVAISRWRRGERAAPTLAYVT